MHLSTNLLDGMMIPSHRKVWATMTTSIVSASFKGGVGKTTTTSLLSYLLADLGFKVLVVDFDPQRNTTSILSKTFPKSVENKISFFEGIKSGDISGCIRKMSHHLDLIPAGFDLIAFPEYVLYLSRDKERRMHLLDHLLGKVRRGYDFVLIDVPPTVSEFTNNAVMASDYTIIPLQTEQQSLEAADQMINVLKDLRAYKPTIDLLAVIPYLITREARVDKEVLEEAVELFGDTVTQHHVYRRERIKRFYKTGITDADRHDEEALNLFRNIRDELLSRLNINHPSNAKEVKVNG